MAQGKSIMVPFVIVNGTSLASSFTSASSSIKNLDRVCLAIVVTGNATGTIAVQASNDSTTYYDMPLNLNALSGSGDSYFIDIQNTAIRDIRIKYTSIAGTGNMTATISAKES